MTRQAPNTSRRPYERPQVFRIRVAGDELAVAGCKTASSAGGPVNGCAKFGTCKVVGS
jgi:hypothetical protein